MGYVAVIFLALFFSQTTCAATLEVYGWGAPVVSGDQLDFSVGDDPVFGRLACPPLTRLNLEKRQSEPLLLKKVVEVFKDEVKGSLWRLELRTDVYWWSGEAFSAKDLAFFLEKQLVGIVRFRSESLWPLPDFTVTADDKNSVSIRWRKPPVFGPYILNGIPLWRAQEHPAGTATNALKFECTGLYEAQVAPFGIHLVPSKSYRGVRPKLVIYPESKDLSTTSKSKLTVAEASKRGFPANVIEFQRASLFGGSPWARLSDEEAICKQRIDLPAVTLLTWNTQSGPTREKQFRKLMTELTPRGALLRSGAANLGELLSVPVPRLHPGYNSRVLVRPFRMEYASKELGKLGYKRKAGDTPRLGLDGKPLRLVFGTTNSSAGLVEKVLADAFTAIGIGVEFVGPDKLKGKTGSLAGVLTGVTLEWPRSDLLLNFHGGLKNSPLQSYPFWPLPDKELDQELEAYALSLTTATPDFSLLSRIHARLFDLEPVTVLMQHKACVEAGGNLAEKLKAVSIKDPDWFRRIVL